MKIFVTLYIISICITFIYHVFRLAKNIWRHKNFFPVKSDWCIFTEVKSDWWISAVMIFMVLSMGWPILLLWYAIKRIVDTKLWCKFLTFIFTTKKEKEELKIRRLGKILGVDGKENSNVRES